MSGDYQVAPVSLPLASLLSELHIESFGRQEGWDFKQMRGSLMLDTTEGWIAYDEREPGGFILCQTVADEIEILTFCVRPLYRRRKIGELLLKQVMAASQQKGGKRIFLEVAADNVPARKLYERFGFKHTGNRPNYYRRGTGTADALMFCYLL